jgi:hypothetical protein
MPPMSAAYDEPTMRDMGRAGFLHAGHYWLLGTTHYVWYTLDGVGWDPGDFDTALDGRTGIQVALTGGNRTAAQVATATAIAIDSVEGVSASADGASVAVVGTASAAAGARGIDDAGEFGIVGMQYVALAGINSFANAATSAALLDAAEMPSGPVLITGFRMSVGDTHTAGCTVAVYQGGVSDTDGSTAALLGVAGVTTPGTTEAEVYVAAAEPFVVDFSEGDVWVAWSHDAAGFEAPYPFNAGGGPLHIIARDTSNWVVASGFTTREHSGITLTSDPEDWPSTLPAVTSQTVGMPPIALSYVSAADFQSDMAPVGRIGTRAAAGDLTGESTFTLLVGNSFTSPSILGMSVYDAGVAYASHAEGSDYRLSLATGGAAVDDFSGASFTDIGLADGTDTGWVDAVPVVDVPIAPNSRIWIMIHHTAGASSLAFDPDGGDAIYDPVFDPAAYYNGNTSESEADDGTLAGTPSTNVEFDEDVPQSGVVSPNGTIYNNNNNVGVRLRYAVRGFAVSA